MDTLFSAGKKIANARERNGLRQADVANIAKLSRATVDAIENGRAKDIGISRLIRLLTAVGLELSIHPAVSQRPTLDDLLKEDADD